jgi:hypothetical protein
MNYKREGETPIDRNFPPSESKTSHTERLAEQKCYWEDSSCSVDVPSLKTQSREVSTALHQNSEGCTEHPKIESSRPLDGFANDSFAANGGGASLILFDELTDTPEINLDSFVLEDDGGDDIQLVQDKCPFGIRRDSIDEYEAGAMVRLIGSLDLRD